MLARSLTKKVLLPIVGRKSSSVSNKFWEWTTKARPNWKENYTEAAVMFVIFGVTGSSSMFLIRPALKNVFGLEGSLVEGPNSYRVASILMVSPFYACILLLIGTVSGRHNYFAKMSMKILGRFVPKTVIHKVMCTPAKSKLVK
jgi:hypothetical protein